MLGSEAARSYRASPHKPLRWLGVGFCLALVLGLSALAVSPDLHLRFHTDATKPGHRCGVTDFAAGLAEVPMTTMACLALCLVMLVGLGGTSHSPVTDLLLRLSPCRAPPAEARFRG